MTTFTDMLATDLESVFFNSEEFAATVTYNGEAILAIEADGYLMTTGLPGVSMPTRTIMVKASDVATAKPGDVVVMGGNNWHVGSGPILSGGVWTVTLERERLTVGV